MHHIFQIEESFFHCRPCDSFDSSDAGSDTAFAHNFHHTDIAGVSHMSTAAQFHRMSVFDYSHTVAVFFAEKCHGTHGFCFRDRHIAVFFSRNGFANHGISHAFHFADFIQSHFLIVREVESKHGGVYH